MFQKDRIYNNNIKCNERQIIIIWNMEEREKETKEDVAESFC